MFIFCLACSARKESAKDASEAKVDTVETVVLRRMQPGRTIVLPGDLRPWEVVSIQAKVKGYVQQVRVDRGSSVKKGAILAILEAPELQAQQAEARARVEDFKSKQIASQLTYRRMLQTSKTQGAVAANELDIAKSRMMVDSLQVLSAMASLDAVGEMIKYLNLTAPFDGLITERNISSGELVGPERTKPMFVLENNETLRLTVGIPEIYSGQIKSADKVRFKVTASPEREFDAKLSRSSQSLDFNLRSMMAEFDVPNQSHLLKAGMYAEVTLSVERTVPTLFAPASAVVNSTERIFVIQVNNRQARWVDVKTGVQTEGMVEIFGAIDEGVPVVARASEELRDGSTVISKSSPAIAGK